MFDAQIDTSRDLSGSLSSLDTLSPFYRYLSAAAQLIESIVV